MIEKVCHFPATSPSGESLVRVYSAAKGLEKTAGCYLPAVRDYLTRLRPDPNKIYVLVNALGAGEYWGSNINSDYFPEAALIHSGSQYGYTTFYNAFPYIHHQNKDATKAFGHVDLAVWNNDMKRVELVIVVDREKAAKFGATSVCDKLDQGAFQDVSMGCRVPYDLCSICTDWREYRIAQHTFDPNVHANVGQAVLAEHKKKPIQGLSITRKDYCSHLLNDPNRILPDGRRICAINDYPKFFDISFVFIGADRTAKVMAKLAGTGAPTKTAQVAVPTAGEDEGVKIAHVATPTKTATIRSKVAAQVKASEILKEIAPSKLDGKAIAYDHDTPDLPKDMLDTLGAGGLPEALSTLSGMGILLKPQEFQRITLIHAGSPDLADKLDSHGMTFPCCDEETPVSMGPSNFSEKLFSLLRPLMGDRSIFEPAAKRRTISITIMGAPKTASVRPQYAVHGDALMSKMAAAYNGYLTGAIECFKAAPDFMKCSSRLAADVEFTKTGADPSKLLAAIGGAYALSQIADWERTKKEKKGQPSGSATALLADHPKSLMLLAALAALHAEGSTLPARLMAGLDNSVRKLTK